MQVFGRKFCKKQKKSLRFAISKVHWESKIPKSDLTECKAEYGLLGLVNAKVRKQNIFLYWTNL